MSKSLMFVMHKNTDIQTVRSRFASKGVKIYSDASYRTRDFLFWMIKARDDDALTSVVVRYSSSLCYFD